MVPTPDPAVIRADADLLLRALLDRAGDEGLRRISVADFGLEAADHLAHLRSLAEAGQVPQPLAYYPREVLELTSYAEPRPSGSPAEFRAAHLRCAFACAALLRSYGDPDGRLAAASERLLQLIRSLHQSEARLDREAAAFLAWLIPRLPPADLQEHAFFGFGLLWFALAPGVDADDRAVRRLIDWIMLSEDAFAGQWRAGYGASPTGPWLLHAELRPKVRRGWRDVASRLAERAEHRRPAVREAVQLMVAMLDE